MVRGLCLVLPCPCEGDMCKTQLFISIDSLIRHIMYHNGNHYGWVRMVLGIPGTRNVTFDDVKQVIAQVILPKWLRLVIDKGNRREIPRCLTPSIYRELFREHWRPRHNLSHADMRNEANRSTLRSTSRQDKT